MDIEYWNNYYKKDITSHQPSSFSKFCMKNYFLRNMCLVELGSGNCRDAEFFKKNLLKVYAIDQSHEANISENIRLEQEDIKSITLIESDFTSDRFDFEHIVDIFYSRFTMHSITESQQNQLLVNVFQKLKINGLFCIEARTINDPMFGEGTNVGVNEFFTDHYRRFLDLEVFNNICKEIGFNIIYSNESNDLSVVGDDNPVLMRVIMRKEF